MAWRPAAREPVAATRRPVVRMLGVRRPVGRRLVVRWAVGLASKCKGSEGECDDDGESELHVGRVDRWDQRLKAVTSLRDGRSDFIVSSPMRRQFSMQL